MSCYEWERGEFTVPSAEWAKFKAGIREVVNKTNEMKLQLAEKVYEAASNRFKADKTIDIHYVAYEEAEKLNRVNNGYRSKDLFEANDLYDVVQSVQTDRKVGDKWKRMLVKPKKKDFPQHGNNVTEFQSGDASLTFDNNARKVYWDVSENNHACDDARASALGKAFFKSLDKVSWVKGTGGNIIGNDEYNSEGGRDHEGGGGSYSKGSWGPKEKSMKDVTPSILRLGRF